MWSRPFRLSAFSESNSFAAAAVIGPDIPRSWIARLVNLILKMLPIDLGPLALCKAYG